jgi:CBS domain-containing protein
MVSRGARHLPVLDGERVLGLVSVRGVLRYIRREVMAG